MNQKVEELIRTLKEIEEEMEAEFNRAREQFRFKVEEKRVRFAEEVIPHGLRLKMGLLPYLNAFEKFHCFCCP